MFDDSWDIGSMQREMIHNTLREVEHIVQSSMNLYFFKVRQSEVSSDGDTVYFDVRYGSPGEGVQTLTTGAPLSMLINRDTKALSMVFIHLLSDKI